MIIKCKMCGGDVVLSKDKTFGTCEYCGSTMTFPKISDEQRAAAFNRGNHFRRIGEFDKALAVYERIVAEDENDAEAHWCCALCRFGIEYVEDPSTYEWLPTCHRASFDSFLEDVDYLAAVEHSDGITRRQYQKDAAKIAEVQRGILAASQNTEPYDVFISYKELDSDGKRTRDSVLAQDVYYQLTEHGWRVFFSRISLEDVPGTEYEPYIFAALNSAKVMVVIGTSEENLSAVWVKNEWSRYLSLMKKDRSKLLIPCYRDMDPYDLPEQLSVLMSYDMGKIGFIQDLIRGIDKVLSADRQKETTHEVVKETVVVQQQSEGSMKTDAAIKRGKLALEDGEWEKAKQYFDQALSLDAECAEAYFGIALAELRTKDPESYIRVATSQVPKSEKLSIPEDNTHIQKAVAENAITGFLKESEITPLYCYDLSYSSTLKGQKEIQNQVRQQIETNRNLNRALRFAQGEEKTRIDGFKNTLYAQLKENVENARKQEEENRNRVKQNYEKFLKEADQKAHGLNQEARAQQTSAYQSAINLQEKAKTIAEYQAAIAEFKRTPGFQNTATRIQSCEKTISDIQERERREKAEQERKAAAKKKRTMAILCVLAAFGVAAFFVVTKIVIPKMQYANSRNLRNVGNIVTFGTYEQDNNTANGKEAIEWIVLANEGNKSLLISRYALDSQKYNKKSESVTWESCSLRPWLNGTFVNEAFSSAEQNAILKTSVDNSKSQGRIGYSTAGGNDTTDQLFLLSVAEVAKYFSSSEDRICKPTAYAKVQGAYDNDSVCRWWLRSPGYNLYYAEYVWTDGYVGATDVNNVHVGVRPAFWINLESEYFK